MFKWILKKLFSHHFEEVPCESCGKVIPKTEYNRAYLGYYLCDRCRRLSTAVQLEAVA